MSSSAFQKQYLQQTIDGFEQRQSLLRMSVTTETEVRGNEAIFMVADSGSAEARTRGINGQIPPRNDNLTQYTCTISEWHDLVERTGFNIFASQGNGVKIMQDTTIGVINRKIDDQIITELNTGTVNTGAATTATLPLIAKAKTKLGNAKVPWDGRLTLLCTPAFEGYLIQMKEFESAEYISGRPMENGGPAWSDRPMMYKWLNLNIIVHPGLPGAGTAAEKCFMYHQSAIGHAADTASLKTAAGYEEKQDQSYCRASMYMGAKLLQNSGVIVINHDGSALSQP